MYHGFGARKHVNNLKNKEPTTFQRLEIRMFSQQIGHSIKRDIAQQSNAKCDCRKTLAPKATKVK